MKIKNLIQFLKEYNPNADITTPSSEDITLSYICKDNNNNPLNKQSTTQVFIEGRDSAPICVYEYNKNGLKMCKAYNKPCELVEKCVDYEEVL